MTVSDQQRGEQAFRCRVQTTGRKLLEYCEAHDFAGYDPYDALNSRLFEALPLLNSRIPRLVLTQALKRSPINVRRLLLIPPTQNPKAFAIFIAALLQAPELREGGTADLVRTLSEKLVAMRSDNGNYSSWGYCFPWQTRTIIVPRGSANLVCTTFVADALLNLYDQDRDVRWLNIAFSAAEYILQELYWEQGPISSFSYPLPTSRGQCHNANFLAAALLCRVHKYTGEPKFVEPALRAARGSVALQHPDGSWLYGEAPTQAWIDNFHTGYNLCALQQIGIHLGTREFEAPVRRGLDFYRKHFFTEENAPRYFHNRTYPLDIHCVAQSIITLLAFRNIDSGNVELARAVFDWAMDHMWDERGFFYYRVLRMGTIRTPYMRWSQSWMLLALSTLLRETAAVKPGMLLDRSPATSEI